LSNSISNPRLVWEETWETLSDGIVYHHRRSLNIDGEYWLIFFPSCSCTFHFLAFIMYLFHLLWLETDLVIPPHELQQICLCEIDKQLRLNGKTLDEHECMPKILCPDVDPFGNVLIANKLSYDSDEMLKKHEEYYRNLNHEQLVAYESVLEAVDGDLGRMFFVDG
jgi:hypothetical protein